MKKLMILAAALFLVAATSGMAMAYTYADQVIYMGPGLPEIAGDPHTRWSDAGRWDDEGVYHPYTSDPRHAPSMNMNWLNNPGGLYTSPNPYNDRLLGGYDQYAVGWGPLGPEWTGTANTIVHMAQSFTRDGLVVNRPGITISDPNHTTQTLYPDNPLYTVTDENVLSGMGYDLVIYGLGYGFNECFESHAMTTVRVSEDGENWITVSSWNGDPKKSDGHGPYYLNQDGTFKNDGGYKPFNNGGFGAWSYTFMTIDLDNPLIVESVDEYGNPVYKDIGPIDGEFNYIWFEGGDLWDNPDVSGYNGNANFLDAFGANAVPIPGAVWLLGSGLLGLIGIRRRKG